MTKIFDQCNKSRFYRLLLRCAETLGKIDGDGFSLDGAEALSLSSAVDCRIGSLEIHGGGGFLFMPVDCRIGSLEKDELTQANRNQVDCRIGSLEKKDKQKNR